jgi:hypothetical protein
VKPGNSSVVYTATQALQTLTRNTVNRKKIEEWLRVSDTELPFQESLLRMKNYPSHPVSFKEEKNVVQTESNSFLKPEFDQNCFLSGRQTDQIKHSSMNLKSM